MDRERIKSIRKEARLTQTGLSRVLRLADARSIRHWENGTREITGPVSVIMELMESGELPERFYS